MSLICSHCSRMNSPNARYCWLDGASLVGSAGPVGAGQASFASPFVFSTGTQCRDFAEFLVGCNKHWDEAKKHLETDALQKFFGGIGRMDLAQAAQEAAHFPDRDRGLDQFLSRIPVPNATSPRLEVTPKLIQLGPLTPGKDGAFDLTLENTGSRIVYGSIAPDCAWLAATEPGVARHFQFRESATISIKIKGQHLHASAKPLEAVMVVESNAGTFRLKVIAQVPIVPFEGGVFTGARTPRDIAEYAKKYPKDAAKLFEDGVVAKWYADNGWTYPVQGQATSGLAAVQQFFEALGLSKPPKAIVDQSPIRLRGKPGETLTHNVQIRTNENRPIYAHAASPDSWIVAKPSLTHQNVVTLPLEITIPDRAGANVDATITVTANGNQQFRVPIMVTVDAPISIAAASVTSATPTEGSADCRFSEPRPSGIGQQSAERTGRGSEKFRFNPRQVLMHAVPLVLLALVLCGLLVKDLLSNNPRRPVAIVKDDSPDTQAKQDAPKVVVTDEPDEGTNLASGPRFKIEDEPEERIGSARLQPVKVEIKDEPAENNGPGQAVPIGATPLVTYLATNPPKRFGITGTAAAGPAAFKQLTYSANGSTNTTVVSVNGATAELGGFQGKWTRLNLPLDGIPPTANAVRGTHSTWQFGTVTYNQVLEIVPGQPVTVNGVSRRNLDTVLIRWVIHNIDSRQHSAGLRLQLDTLIGSNDGVPFTVPGQTGLVSTFADYRDPATVPDFIQALERFDLNNPGTVAHMTLKPGGGIEPAQRLSLTHWPGASLVWNIPVRSLTGDSAAVLYWPEKTLKPGEKRTIGFAYGLGNVSATDKLGLTLGGSFEPGQAFTATAYVESPIVGQTVRLELPDGLKRIEGAETQPVAIQNAGGRNTSVVTWKILVERTGDHRLKVVSSTGLSQSKTISISGGATSGGGRLAIDLQGSFEPGQTFIVLGKVTDPSEDQTLTLNLPAGLQLSNGSSTQRVPTPPAELKYALVQWSVRVISAGRYPVRVVSSTGVTQTKTITIEQPGRADGAFNIVLTGDFEPGKTFNVSTKVVTPVPGQALTLILPTGLTREDGAETQTATSDASLVWKVRVTQVGKYTVGVKSTTGITQRKTLMIEPPGESAGRFTFELVGDIQPGKEFTVKAQVAKPVTDQKLTLNLPKGLTLVKSDAEQLVPREGNLATLTWQVRVTGSGRLPVRVESSTGLARTKTISLTDGNSSLFGR